MSFTDDKNDGAVYAGQPKDKLAEIIRKKDEALEFYANSLYYKTKFNEESNSEELLYTELFDDMGELAQQALKIGDKE